MGLFEKIMGQTARERRAVLYHSPTWLDCAAAREFFLANDVELVEYDVTSSEDVRQQMVRDYGRVATPAIVIGRRVFWGFEENKQEIAELLGIELSQGSGSRESDWSGPGSGAGSFRSGGGGL